MVRKFDQSSLLKHVQFRNSAYWILWVALALNTFSFSHAQAQTPKAELRTSDADNSIDDARKFYEEALDLYRRGQFAEAIPIAERALAIRERSLGIQHLDVALALNLLGRLYQEKTDYAKAESSHRRALAIREDGLGAKHLLVAESLNNLAIILKEKGDYSRAEPLYQRALEIREKAVGPDDTLVAQSLHNLANLHKAKGDFVRAVQIYQRAIAIREKVHGVEDPDLATSLNNLANLYRDLGDYRRSELLHLRVLAIWEKALGQDHPDVAISLNNLALMYFKMGEYAKAEPLYHRALAIREKTLGAEHPLVASSINNLANLYRDQGELARAEPLHLRALAIWEKALGPEHRIVASSLNDVANMYRDKGDFVHAEPLYQRALAIREKALAVSHPAIASLLDDFAVMYMAQGDTRQTVKFLSRANDIREFNLALILTTGSEEQKRLYLDTLADETDVIVSLNVGFAINDVQTARLAFTNVLRRKGRVLDAMSNQIATLRSRLSSEDQLLLDRSSAVRGQLAALVLGDSVRSDPAQRGAMIAALAAEVEQIEAAISIKSLEFRSRTRAVTLDAVQKALPSDAALVEIVSYRPFNPKATKRNQRFGASHYVAFVLTPEGAVHSVELGDAASIDGDVARLRAALADPKSSEVKQLARALGQKVMRPIGPLLDHATHLLISPDGQLNLIPFEVLVDEPGRYLIERYSFSYLSSGRDLLRMESTMENARHPDGKPLVIANPSFGEPIADAGASRAIRLAGLGNKRRSVTSARSLSEVYFAPLGGTAREAITIKQLFPEANILTETGATESAIKQTPAPPILHVATHGFFLTESNSSDGEDRGSKPAFRESVIRNSPGVVIRNPLLRSGLALANANRRNGSSSDDGILTALEASGLNLWGTKLVVLSACDTGLGQIRNGEGVYGLRRGFVLAGAESLVMSLWPVSDYPTKKLMTQFYQNLKQGMGRGMALRQAQLKMVKADLHPFYWANFIQSNEWANLDGKR